VFSPSREAATPSDLGVSSSGANNTCVGGVTTSVVINLSYSVLQGVEGRMVGKHQLTTGTASC